MEARAAAAAVSPATCPAYIQKSVSWHDQVKINKKEKDDSEKYIFKKLIEQVEKAIHFILLLLRDSHRYFCHNTTTTSKEGHKFFFYVICRPPSFYYMFLR